MELAQRLLSDFDQNCVNRVQINEHNLSKTHYPLLRQRYLYLERGKYAPKSSQTLHFPNFCVLSPLWMQPISLLKYWYFQFGGQTFGDHNFCFIIFMQI